jgi:hypothetical protein
MHKRLCTQHDCTKVVLHIILFKPLLIMIAIRKAEKMVHQRQIPRRHNTIPTTGRSPKRPLLRYVIWSGAAASLSHVRVADKEHAGTVFLDVGRSDPGFYFHLPIYSSAAKRRILRDLQEGRCGCVLCYRWHFRVSAHFSYAMRNYSPLMKMGPFYSLNPRPSGHCLLILLSCRGSPGIHPAQLLLLDNNDGRKMPKLRGHESTV